MFDNITLSSVMGVATDLTDQASAPIIVLVAIGLAFMIMDALLSMVSRWRSRENDRGWQTNNSNTQDPQQKRDGG